MSHLKNGMPESAPKAVITGGQGDLAQAIAESLRNQGYVVEAPGRDQLDVTQAKSVTSYFAQHGDLSLLVNNAGVTRDGLLVKLSEETWHEVIETNLKGAWLCCREASKHLCKSRTPGHLLQIGSFAALKGTGGQSAYAAAKAGLIGLTKSLAKELGPRGIRSNCVLPGFLETKMTADLPHEVVESVLEEHCLKRFTTKEDTAMFIASLDRLTGVSGQVFHLDSRITRW